MKKIVSAIALFLISITSALAAKSPDTRYAVGAGYGFGLGGSSGVFSLHGDYNIADRVKAPVSVRVGLDHYSINYGILANNYSWSYNVFYGGAFYDFNEILKIDDAIHPFLGLGIGFGSASCTGSFCGSVSTPTVGGFYYIAGLQYNITSNIAAEANFSGWTGISLGAAYRF